MSSSRASGDPDGATIPVDYKEDDNSSQSSDSSICFGEPTAAGGGHKSTGQKGSKTRRNPTPAKTQTRNCIHAKTPTGLTVKRRGAPGSGSVSAMTTPTPTNNKRKQRKKRQNEGAPSTVTGEEEPAPIIKWSRSKPAACYDEAKVDSAHRKKNDVTNAEDSDDEEWEGWDDPEWEEELQKVELLEGLLKLDGLSVEPDHVESDDTCKGKNEVVAVGGPEGWKPHGPPATWKPKKGDEPEFSTINDPGKWSRFTFRPVCKNPQGRRGFVEHRLPTGCVPVPEVKDGPNKGKHIEGGWEFDCTGTFKSPEGSNCRHGATRDNVFPKERKGSLCAKTLKKLGMSKPRLSDPALGGKVDALFFEQLTLPMCDASRSGIVDDPRMPFYFPCSIWTNNCATCDLRLGATHGHAFDDVSVKDLVRWDGCTQMDGALGSSNGAIHRRWDPDCKQHDEDIANSMGISRFQQTKQVHKMCNNREHPKKGEPNYDPSHKFECVWRVMCHNVSAIAKEAELDNTGDESTFPFGAWGEKGTGVTSNAKKPGASRGGQTVVASDVHRVRPRAFLVRHKCHKKALKGQTGGPNEVHHILKQFDEMLMTPQQPADHPDRKLPPHDELTFQPNPKFMPKGTFKSKPHSAWDNYFSGDSMHNHCAEEGCGMTNAVARGSLPADASAKCLQKKGTSDRPQDWCKAAKWIQPMALSKNKKGSTMTLVSFQSTSSCNIASVNACNECSLCAEARERGKGQYKRHWGIEMNESRKLCLSTYNRIDSIDHHVQNLHMRCASHKCWHPGVNLGKAWVKVVAHDICKEMCEGNLDPDWKCDPIDNQDFQEQMSLQKLQHDPRNRMCPGDDAMRPSTQQPTENRMGNQGSIVGSPIVPFTPKSKKRKVSVPEDSTVASCGVTAIHINNDRERPIGILDALYNHCRSVKTFPGKNTQMCDVCGGRSHTHCGICKRPVHCLTRHADAENIHGACFIQCHNISFFGQARIDKIEIAEAQDRKSIELPDAPEMQKNAQETQRVQQSSSETTASTPSVAAAAPSSPAGRTRNSAAAAATAAANEESETAGTSEEGKAEDADADDNAPLAVAASENPPNQKDDNDTGGVEAV